MTTETRVLEWVKTMARYVPCGLVRVPELVGNVNRPAAEVHAALRGLWRTRAVRLVAIGDYSDWTADELALCVPGENEVYGGVELRD